MAREDWLETTIGEQATLQRGIDITKAEQRVGRVPVISSGGISSYHDTAAVKGPGVVLGRKGVVGSVYFIEEDYWPHDTSLWVKDFHGNHPRFVYYFFKSIAPRLAQMDVGSANPTLNRNHVHPIRISWPPLSEQKAIARILGTLDDKIELNRRMNATLEAMARALFQSWFVDFDPVHILAGNTPEKPPFLSAEALAKARFPNSFQPSELGEIPKGWSLESVGSVFHLTMGQSPPGDTYCELGNGMPFYQGRTDFGFRFPTRRMFCTAPTRLAKARDTLVSVRAPVGDINMAIEDCCIGRGVAAVRHKQAAASFTYYAMANLRPHFANYESEGTVFGAINKANFEKLPIINPSHEILTAFEKIAGPIDEQIRANETQSRTLATLRDTLLPKLLSGELSAASNLQTTA
jgi:type I restriction enzyme S subunit